VLHCCYTSDYNAYVGNLVKQSVDEIWNSDSMKTIRREMISGIEPALCSRCYESEKYSGTSPRRRNFLYDQKLLEIPFITRSDGSLTKTDLQHLDFRFSNICNYKCRMCSPWNSNAWIPDAIKLDKVYEKGFEEAYGTESLNQILNLDFIDKNLKSVKSIYFSGGEPLLMDEHWHMLENLEKQKRFDIKLSYNSNLSLLKYKDKKILQYWTKWGKNVLLRPSIDEIDERAELIRSGTKWKNVEANLEILRKTNIAIEPTITVSAMNVFRIPDIITRLVDIGIIRGNNHKSLNWRNFRLNVVTEPQEFHVSILPDQFRKDIRENINKFILSYSQQHHVDIENLFLNLFWHLQVPWNEEQCRKFKRFTREIDKIRDEHTAEIIPELKCILDQ